jgi:hypothetical protein
MTIPRANRLDMSTLFELLAQELPNLDRPCLCVGLHLASICLGLAHKYPSLPGRLDLGFIGQLLEVDDEKVSHGAVEVLLEAIQSPDYITKIGTPEFLIPLLGALENRPFESKHSAALTISEAIKKLPIEDIEELVDRHFIDSMLQFLDIEDLVVAQQTLQTFFRMATHSQKARDAISQCWDELRPLHEWGDEPIQSLLMLLDTQIHPVDR